MPQPKLLEQADPRPTVEVFCSYSHKDEGYRKQLETHVSLMKRQELISLWHDRRINAGTEWKRQIDERLNAADLILFLVSADFIASDYCYDIEMKQAMKRHKARKARAIPVILRAVDGWEETPFGKLQAIPANGKPVKQWRDRDEAFKQISHSIKTVVYQIIEKKRGLKPVPPSGIVRKRNRVTGRVETIAFAKTIAARASLIIDSELEQFDAIDRKLLLQAIAHELEIPWKELRIMAVEKHNSIKVTVEFPDNYEEDLKRAFKEGRLKEALEPLKLLDVKTENDAETLMPSTPREFSVPSVTAKRIPLDRWSWLQSHVKHPGRKVKKG